MATSEARDLAPIIDQLFRRLIIRDIPERVSYRGWLSEDRPFALDEEGYGQAYAALLRWVFSVPRFAYAWSEEGIAEKAHGLLLRLAQMRYRDEQAPDVNGLAQEWLAELDVDHPSRECYVPVVGLALSTPLRLGEITFIPLPEARAILAKKVHLSFLEGLQDTRDCIASGSFSAEPRRATDIMRARTEIALNLLRYLGLLVWHNQPTRHMYLSGQQRERVSYAVSIDPSGAVSEIGSSEFTPVPFLLNGEFIQYARFHGLDFFTDLIASSSRSEIEDALLLAANWCGDSAQELSPLTAFMKSYVSIETATKMTGEDAGSVLPLRISVLLEPYSRAQQTALMDEIAGLIRERNAVFHSGRPALASPEQLAWLSKRVAVGTVNQLRQRIISERLKTKEELKIWVRSHRKKWLR